MINKKTKQRELAYLVKIDAIEPIVGSDNCEAAVIGGWKVMVRKGTFKPGDLAVYFEIDSKLPEKPEYEFLAKKHYKVKTQKYTFGGKGCFISQGLLMALDDFETNGSPAWLVELKTQIFGYLTNPKMTAEEIADKIIGDGYPLTETLGVKYSVVEDNKRKGNVDKYKRMAQRHWKLFKHNKLVQWLYKRIWGKKLLFLFLGRKRDSKAAFWPSWVVKTDEERVQNLPQLFPGDETKWYVTEKIDGSSTTFTMKRGKFGKYEFYVCSRNVCFDKAEKEEKLFYDTNIYTEMAEKYNIYEVLKDMLDKDTDKFYEYITIQGETYGKNVQKNEYGLNERRFMAFNLIYGDKEFGARRLNPKGMTEVLAEYNVPCVPIIDEEYYLPETIDEILEYATDQSKVNPDDLREGIVLRTDDGVNSFKAVSNEYLISKNE